MCEIDYSDCRDDIIKALQVALNAGIEPDSAFETSLVSIDKVAAWQLAQAFGDYALADWFLSKPHLLPPGTEQWHDRALELE